MNMICEKCGQAVSVAEGEYGYFQNRMMFACKACAEKMTDEMKCAQKICAAVDGRKTRAVQIIKNQDAFGTFLKNVDATGKKIPTASKMHSEIPLLLSLVKSYVSGEYREISCSSIVATVATLLYVISPIDIIPDVIPEVGFSDDAMAVAFCVKMLHGDLEKFKAWRDRRNAMM